MDTPVSAMPQPYQYEERITHIPIAHVKEIEKELKAVVLSDQTRNDLVEIAPQLSSKWAYKDGQAVYLLTTGDTTIILYDIPCAHDEGKVLASANLNRSLYVRDDWLWWEKYERLVDAHYI